MYIKRLFAILASSLILLIISPNNLFAATNYGDGTYGAGVYNVGETPVPISTTDTSSSGASQCTNTTPQGLTPWLYEANSNNGNSITLRFTNWQSPIDHFSLEYGTGSNKYTFGVNSFGNKDTNSYTVSSLLPNTTYYFRVRAGNGCATGSWSNELSTKTLGTFSTNNLNIVSSNLEPVTPSSTSVPSTLLKTTVGEEEGYLVNVKVKDTKGNTIKGAEITIHSVVQTKKTDNNGVASFSNVEAGNHLVQIAYNSYQGEQSINLTGDVKEFNLNITIELKNPFLTSQVIIIIGVLILVIGVLALKLIKKRKAAL